MTSVRQRMDEALSHYEAGRWTESERLCRIVLDERPDQGDAWHVLGLLALQASRPDLAVEQIGRSVELDGANPAAHNNLGLALTDLGDPEGAEARFRLAVLLAPNFAEAHSNLGAAQRALGRWSDAEASLRRSLELKPGFAAAHLNLALVHRSLGKFDAALDQAEAALLADPDSTAAAVLQADLRRLLAPTGDAESVDSHRLTDHLDLANAFLAQGRFIEAEAECRKALQTRPDLAEAHNALGAALLGLGRPSEAEVPLREAIRRAPGLLEARVNLSEMLLALDRPQEAADCLALVVDNAPGHADAMISLGKALRELGKLDEAAEMLNQAVRHRPGSAEARTELAHTLHQLGLTNEAINQFETAASLARNSAARLERLGLACQEVNLLDQAEASYQKSLTIRPDHSPTLGRLTALLGDQGRDAEARAMLETPAARLDARLQVARATLLPPIYRSADDLRARRLLLTEELDQLHRDNVRLDPTHQTVPTLFFLAYQGGNDRDLQRSLARLVATPDSPRLAPRQTSKGSRPIRVGFLSSHFHDHTIGQLMKGVVAHLSRDELTVVVLSASNRNDETARWMQKSADETVKLPRNLPAARQAVVERALDVLVYTDIGMDPFTYTLALSRLAPIQCATWGHPVTTGLETIDHYLSSALLEGPEADGHYTENLVRLPAVSVYYDRPPDLGPIKSRASLGLPATGNLYVCPQSLFKFHPEFDTILGAILRRDPQGRLILLKGWHDHWEKVLRDRLEQSIGDVCHRIQFVPRLGHEDFRHLCARADILLDPIHFGGGHTSYEALALGTPIVTLPSSFLRGRITQALYRTMGVTDCIASSEQEYIDLSIRLGTDPDRRAAVKNAILSENHRIFRNEAALRSLEGFFRTVAREPKPEPSNPVEISAS